MDTATNIFTDADIISRYTRAQALEDGVLVAIPTDLVAEAGMRYPMALTAAAWVAVVELTEKDEAAGQDVTGRLWDVLTMFKHYARRAQGDRFSFKVSVLHGRRRRTHILTAVCGPGDTAEPVITIDVAE